jgi:AcrR family transcriptional regulator
VTYNSKKKSPEKEQIPIWHFHKYGPCVNSSEPTRTKLLEAAFEEIHHKGFQAASLSQILKRTGVTKGAFYHYFPSKKDVGHAVIDEIIRVAVFEFWIKPLKKGNPIDTLIEILGETGRRMTLEDIKLGCPLANLSQEMSPVDEDFRERIEALYDEWRTGLSDALKRGQKSKWVRAEIDCEAMSIMLIACIEGCLAAAKNAQNRILLHQCGDSLVHILNDMRA